MTLEKKQRLSGTPINKTIPASMQQHIQRENLQKEKLYTKKGNT
jgi:hypothetical protein